MDNLKKIQQLIEQCSTIILHRHIVPDGDAYGSQLGLKELIKTNYPEKQVFAVGANISYLNYIGSMDEKVPDATYQKALVIVTDCGNVERIDDQRFSQGSFLLKIDHHPDATPYGNYSWVDTSFTSASEMVGYLAMQLKWKITPVAGRIIYHGILTDSLRFLIQATTPRTLEVAAHLLKSGFNLDQLHQIMYQKQFKDLALESELINTAQVTKQGVGYVILTDELLHKYQLKYEENGKFANLLAGVEGVKIWITFAIREDQKWRVEFRSRKLAINDLAVKWGGGGHKLASGAIVDNLNEAMKIVEDANQLIKQNKEG